MGFSAIDYAVLLLYLVGITIFGTLFRKSQKNVKDYFIGAKNIHWIVISLSIVATETSTLTLVGVPAIAYANYKFPRAGRKFYIFASGFRLYSCANYYQFFVYSEVFSGRTFNGL